MEKLFGFSVKRVPIDQAEILYAGTARNVAQFIEKEVQFLVACLGQFKKVHGLIIESDSSDETLVKLKKIKATLPNFQYISYANLSKKMPKRTQRLAHCRNRVIQELRDNPAYVNVDYVVIADLDAVNVELTPQKIAQCWQVKEDWGGITANQGELYYDIWALRHPDWCPTDCMRQIKQLQKICDEKTAHNLAVWARNIHIDPKVGLIPVDSAFGGFGIYKREAYLVGEYEGIAADGEQVCEHVHFHQKLRKAGHKIYINAALINCGRPVEVEAKPGVPKRRTAFAFGFIQSIGSILFGKKRFNKYLDMMRNEEV
jgi:hypothetical protein